MAEAPLGARGWLFVCVLHFVSAIFMVLVIASVPDPSGQVALIYSPFSAPAEAFAKAAATGARIVRVGRKPWIVVVAPEPNAADFAADARANGALLLLNPVVAGGCKPKAGSSYVRS